MVTCRQVYIRGMRKVTGDKLLTGCVNQPVTNGLSHPYHWDESSFISRGNRSIFSFLFHVSMKIKYANRIAPSGVILFAYVP